MRGRSPASAADPATRKTLKHFGAGSFKRIVFPLVALGLVLVLRETLHVLEWGRLSLLYLAAPLLVSWAMIRVIVYFLRNVVSYGGFLTRSERLVSVTIWIGVLLNVTGVDEPLIEILERASFKIGTQTLSLWVLIYSTVIILVTVLVALWLASLLERRLLAIPQMDGNLREVLSRLVKVVLSVEQWLVVINYSKKCLVMCVLQGLQ